MGNKLYDINLEDDFFLNLIPQAKINTGIRSNLKASAQQRKSQHNEETT